ncbi:MAG: ATP-binding protein [Pyrinomonadaceae bacterium]|nr:ATP-binding protein [Pyrinomonadaceae bacterium]
MLDNMPLSEQHYTDVVAFLQQRIGENLTVEYKRELSTSTNKDRSELCKDVSAFANSQGGTVFYGVDEDQPDRTPRLPPYGTPRRVGRQSVEEWASQVLRSGVQPPLDFEMETFDYGGGPDRCVLVVRTNASPSAPHMVTLKADNRYYGRFYRRSNYESRIAEEYEVREMLERARRLYLGIEEELRRRGYADPSSLNFGDNPYTRRLATRDATSGSVARRVRAEMWASLVLVPTAPASRRGLNRAEWNEWLESSDRTYQPSGTFVPQQVRPTLGGVACVKPHYLEGAAADLEEYLLMGFDGSVELGFCPARVKDELQRFFWGRRLVHRLWQTLNFTADVRDRLGLLSPHLLVVNLRNTGGSVLAGFASRWVNQDPKAGVIVEFEDAPKCLEPNVQIRREFSAEDFEEVARAGATPPPQVKELADDVCSAFGLQREVLLDV